ncbi:MAG: hypothetical protein ACE5GJ_02530 [Gemmatimonadota bacterium]
MRFPASAALILLGATACGGGPHAPPQPGQSLGVPPDLRGQKVMLLPVQQLLGVPPEVDAELAFALESRSRDVDWILPARLERAVRGAPGIRTGVRGLGVGMFLRAEVRRVGDPLYGQLRRLAALVDAVAALVPIQAEAVTTESGERALRVSAALIDVRTGRVMWFGVEEGETGEAGDPGALASMADALARTLLWYARP